MKYLSRTFNSKYSLWIYLFIYLFIYFLSHEIWNIIDFHLDETRIGASQSIGTYDLGLMLIVLLIVFPIQLLLTILSFIKYPKQVPLISWNTSRPFWSIFWTIVFTALMYYPIIILVDIMSRHELIYHSELIIFFLVSLYYFMYLRASLVMSTLFQKHKQY
jgi:hypothetical protein